MGIILHLLIGFVLAKNMEGYSSLPPTNPKLLRAWNATAKIKNSGDFKKSDFEIGNIQLTSSSFIGSGVLVKKTSPNTALVITNAHVVSCPRMHRCRLSVSFEINAKRVSTLSVKLLQEFLTKDIALVEVRMREEDLQKIEPAVLADALGPTTTDIVYAIGYPNLSLRKEDDWQTPRPKNYRSELKRISTGRKVEVLNRVIAENYRFLDGRSFRFEVGPVLIHSADTLGGNSGGALLNDEGEVIGLNSGIEFGSGTKHNRYCFQNETITNANLGCSYFAISSNVILTNFGLVR